VTYDPPTVPIVPGRPEDPQPAYPPAQQPVRRMSTRRKVLLGVAGVLALCLVGTCIGGLVAGSPDRPETPDVAAVATSEASPTPAELPSLAPAPATTAAAPTPVRTTAAAPRAPRTTTSTRRPAPVRTSTSTRAAGCDPAYPTVCIPPPPPDLDCGQIKYRNFRVLAPDPHRLDSDNDGIGCET
jgi:hypothetical protein